tara:strand:+ start:1281 stop:2036 length:756 start_codon:yes stop_codon:yes gene_type:complete
MLLETLFSIFSHTPPTITLYPDKTLQYTVKQIYSHNPRLFTQGLSYHPPFLYESTGLYAQSSLIKYHYPNTLISKTLLPRAMFGEGVTEISNTVYQLTWKNHLIISHTHPKAQYKSFYHQGWGLTSIAHQLVYSDGSANIYFQSPDQSLPWKTIEVHDANGPVPNINDLCFHQGLILANIWFSDKVAVIYPDNGEIKGYLDFTSLRKMTPSITQNDVLNGITSINNNTILITGKNWPFLFEIELDLTTIQK